MSGGNLKRPTSIDTQTQTRSKKTRTKSPKDVAEQSFRFEPSETLVDGADVERDHFEDEAGIWATVTPQISRALERAKEPDHWPREFAKTVRKRQAKLLDKLKVKKDAITVNNQQFSTEFFHLIGAALAPIGTQVEDATHPLQIIYVTPSTQPLHTTSAALLEESRKLLAQYQELTRQQSQTRHLSDLAEKFETDKEQVRLAIAAARKVVEGDIDDMLADKTQEVRGRKTITVDDQSLGSDVLRIGQARQEQTARVDPDGEGWGEVASKAKRAVHRLCKAIAMEE